MSPTPSVRQVAARKGQSPAMAEILSTFEDLQLHHRLLKNLSRNGYRRPTEVQKQVIPHILTGRDCLVQAETGAGKTAAMLLPVLHRFLLNDPRQENTSFPDDIETGTSAGPHALVIEPTRELAEQVQAECALLSRGTAINSLVLHAGGGMDSQTKALQKGTDILIATPGRLIDHLMRWHMDLCAVRYLVLDEVDRLCDMGFLPQVEKIVTQASADRQTLLFSATIPDHVRNLSREMTRDPVIIEIGGKAHTPETIHLELHKIDSHEKSAHLSRLIRERKMRRVLVFVNTRKRAQKFADDLAAEGHSVLVLHGDKSQQMRRKALADLRAGRVKIVIATDLGARGLHIEKLSHVINVDVPPRPEQFIHRVGRTGRMGRSGQAITFCSPREERAWAGIRKKYEIHVKVRKF